VAAVFALLLAMVWRAADWIAPGASTVGLVDAGFAVSLIAIVVGSWWRDGIGPRALGLLPSEWSRGWGSMLLFVAAGVAGLAMLGASFDSAELGAARLSWLVDYAPGITAQQLLLQGFFAPHIETLARSLPARPRRVTTIVVSSALFVALHAPNPALMVGVAIASAFWTWHFLVHRNLLAVLLSHLVLGATAMAALGPGPMLSLRVGAGALDLLTR
jgi:hypothetical protein